MPCCCIKTLNLCSVSVCESLDLDKIVTIPSGATTNNYKLILDYFSTTLTLSQPQTDGENISFDISMLNESFEFTGKVYDTSGEVVTFTVDGETYDCIKFKTILNVGY